MTAQIIKNLEVAIDVLTSTPEEKIDLRLFAQDTPCGTIACAIGTLAMYPYFQTQGVILTELPDDCYCVSINGGSISFEGRFIFGEGNMIRLFTVRGNGAWDDVLLAANPYMTDKQLAIARLQRQLAIYKDGAS
jgi:hypothetical protein